MERSPWKKVQKLISLPLCLFRGLEYTLIKRRTSTAFLIQEPCRWLQSDDFSTETRALKREVGPNKECPTDMLTTLYSIFKTTYSKK